MDIFVPNSNFNSSSNQPLKIISSANPTPNPRKIEFINMLGEDSPIQEIQLFCNSGVKIRIIKTEANNIP